MKYIIVLIFLFLSQFLFGEQPFPGVAYSYVKVYLFNINENGVERPDYYIYRDDVYAKTKLGDGKVVPESKVSSLNTVLSGDINTLLIGLSKCFFPRHGFVYYNEKDEPVASVSVCFECEAIRVWSKKGLRLKPNYDKVSVSKAEKQIAEIKEKVVDGLLPVYKEVSKYKDFLESVESIDNQGEMTLSRNDTLKDFVGRLFADSVMKWKRSGVEFVVSEDVKITAGGDKYEFKTFELDDLTKFLFSDNSENPSLAMAEIYNAEIVLPNGVHVGMSLDGVMDTFGIYDGIVYPEIINLETKGLKLSYHFQNNKLVKIKLYVYR